MDVRSEPRAKTRAELLRAIAQGELGIARSDAPIVRRAERDAPLSYSQARLWLMDQLDPSSATYNIPTALRLMGRLDVEALRAALSEIVRRHELLRTTFAVVDGSPRQVVRDAKPVPLPISDLQALSADARREEARRLTQEEMQRSFDLESGPLLRCALLRLGEEEHILLLTMHHIVSDGGSRGILLRELSALYGAYRDGDPSPLSDLPIQYADYASWQREWLEGDRLERQMAYWRARLSGAPSLLDLPADRPRPAVQTFRGAYRSAEIPARLLEGLKHLSQESGATLFMALLAVFQILLHRYTGQDDLVVGTPIANRGRHELERLIGFFVNTLALRGDLSRDPTFRDLLARVRETALGAYDHQDLPFEKLVEELQPGRSLSHSPVFQVVFDYQAASPGALQLPGLRAEGAGGEWRTAKFDLLLTATETGGRLWLGIEYNTDLFDGERMERLLGHFETLLDGIVADPDRRISRLPLLTEPERQRLLLDWNDTAADYPRDRCVHQLFEEQAQRTPDALAIEHDGRRITYADLNRRANRLAHRLQEEGVGPETRVGVCAERSIEMVVGLLGVLKAGGAYLPLDPSYPSERLAFMIEDSGAPVILVQEALRDRVAGGGARLVGLEAWDDAGSDETGAGRSGSSDASSEVDLASGVCSESLAYVIYTSGSTGRPKGVEVVHRSLMNLVSWHVRTYRLGGSDRTTQVARPAFDASVWEIWPSLSVGAAVCIAPEETTLSPGDLVRWLGAVEATVSFLPTPLAEAVLSEAVMTEAVLPEEGLPDGAGLCLRTLLTGGDRLHRVEVGRLPFEVVNHYGPTECTVVATAGAVEEKEGTAPPIGRPIENTRIYLLDGRMEPVPAGVPGELWIGGESLARGYLGRPELTAERFVPDRFSGRAGSRMYRTGDECRYLEDGRIEYLSRMDQQVKVRGFRIELGEIEAALREQSGVREAVVVAREEASGDARLVAYVVGSNGSVSVGEARARLQERLPGYMVPTGWVVLEALPLSANGKVDRKALPEPEGGGSEGEYVAPRTPVEEGLAGIWSEVLGVEAVGAHDDFFGLGGHSLLATQVMSRVRSVFGVEVVLRALFEAPTVAGLAERIGAERSGEREAAPPPLAPVSREGALPLSFAQQRLWFLDQLEPGSAVYNVPTALKLTGSLDVPALERSLTEIVRRHEVLRTTVGLVEDEPVQRIGAVEALRLAAIDLSGLPDEERAVEARRLIAEEGRRPFDLSTGPLFRAGLLRLGEDEHILLLTMHHVVSDAWSQGVLRRELTALYAAFTEGKPSPLGELPLQYADYASWQREWLQGEVLEREIGYWREHLSGAPAMLELPTDRPRPAVQSFRGGRQGIEIDPELTQAVKALGQREGTTLFMTLLAAFQALLYRYSGQEDVVVGTPIANRTRAETEGLIGFFVNTLAVRGDLSGDPSFRELMGRVREAALGAYAHQDLPFEKLVEELQPERSTSHSPIFQVMFTLQNAPGARMDLEGLRIEAIGGEGATAKFDLSVTVSEHRGRLHATVRYNSDLFDPDRVVRLLEHFRTLLGAAVADPDQSISHLAILSTAERRQVVEEWNRTERDYPETQTVHGLFEAAARRTPDAPAVVFEQERLTYRELNERANRLARHLRGRGVGPNVPVGLCVERSLEMVVGLLGILKAGGGYVPLDPGLPRERLAFMLEDSGAKLVVTHEALAAETLAAETLAAETLAAETLAGALPGSGETRAAASGVVLPGVVLPGVVLPGVVLLDGDREAIDGESGDDLDGGSGPGGSGPGGSGPGGSGPEDLVYLIYTSGSTGRPKGVAIEHRQLVNYVLGVSERLGLPEGASYATVSTIAADLGNTSVYPALCGGGCLHVVSSDRAMDAGKWREYFERERIDCLKIVPSHLSALLGSGRVEAGALPGKVLVLGGETSRWELIERIVAGAPGVRVLNHYGPTETTVGVLTYEVSGRAEERGREAVGSQTVPLGRPLGNSRVYLLNESGEPVPVGVAGELYIGGKGVGRGYLNREELTAERFVEEGFVPGGRMYRTGDRARYLRDGSVEFLGRVDHQVKVRGFRIELGEIEGVLREQSGVREAVVVAREEASGDARLVAYVVGSNGSVSVGEARARLQERLPGYMVPTGWVVLEALPLSANGKVDRKALPEPEGGGSEGEYVAPRTPVEEGLAGIWSEVLGVEAVGAHDDFFGLGGHSLLATQVMSRVRSVFGVEVALRALFEAPTVAGLAERIGAERSGEREAAPPLAPVSREGALPLSFAQQRLWFLDQLEPGSAVYNVPTALKLTGSLDVPALERSLTEIVRRHEVLRTTVGLVEDEPVQRIGAVEALRLAAIDLSGLPDEERAVEARRLIAEEGRRPFDLSTGPLFRAGLLRLGEDEHILLLTMHHVVSDAWSQGVLRRELTALYAAFTEGKPSPLGELPLQYADYASWQREWLQGEVLEREIGYWREHLSGAPAMLELPTDRPRPAVQSFRGAQRGFVLSSELTDGLKDLGRQEGATLFMTLLAAFQALLYRYSGQEDVVVGTPIANRTRAETEGLIGFFVNTLAVRGDLSGDPSFRELMGRVREAALGAYAHQDLPFEKLVEEIQPGRTLSRSPIFQVMFTLQNAPKTALEMEGLRIARMSAVGVTAKFDLSLAISENGGRLHADLEYNSDLFDADRMERLLAHLRELLQSAVADPDRKVSRLTLLTEPERRQLLVDWNDTAADLPIDRCVHQWFEQQVERTPDAVVVECGDESVSYADLNARANQLARYLRKQGVGPETLVGLCLERSVEMVVGLLGVLKAGGAYVPLDPSNPADRLAFILDDCGAPVLLTHEPLRTHEPLLGSLAASLTASGKRVVDLAADRDAISAESPANPGLPVDPENAAYVIYTSGSTGRPKGALIRHGGLSNYLAWASHAYRTDTGEGSPVHSSLSFDLTVTSLYPALLTGRKVRLVREEEGVEALAGALRTERDWTLVKLTPAHLELLSHQIEAEEAGGRTRAFIVGGEALRPEQIAYWREHAPGTRIVNEYGPTETVVGCCVHECGEGDNSAFGSVPIGRPIANTRLYLLDGKLEPVPVGVPGELYIGGAGLARGYLDRPELTAERFVPDRFGGEALGGEALGGEALGGEAGGRLYRTGDLCRYRADGTLDYLGRMDHQVKVRGFRIELGEIESVLTQHPGVGEAAVVARETEPGEKRLVAYLVGANGALDVGAVREHLRARLPEYMVPTGWVELEALPLGPSGKVDRKALPEPDGARQDVGTEFELPRTAVEETLAKIWADVLRLDRVGIHDNFFELGGDSILTIRIIARANQAGLGLAPKQMFQHQTIAGLASVAGTARAHADEQGLVTGPVGLTPIQSWFFECDRTDPHHYNQARLLLMRRTVDPSIMRRGIDALLTHHDALRLRFSRSDAGWTQRIAGEETNPVFSSIDLSNLAAEDRAPAMSAECARLQASLDLMEGPLLRAACFDLGPDQPARLLLVIHHLAVDGVSWPILLADLEAALDRIDRGDPVVLPPKTTSFQRWSRLLAEHAATAELARELDYWTIEARRRVGRLPIDESGGDNATAAQRVVRATLDAERTDALLRDVPAAYHTQMNDVLLSALAQAFASWTGARTLLVDLEGHGRDPIFDDVDLSRTVGWFTTLYPVLLELPSGSDPGLDLKSVKEQLRGIPNRGIGYGLLRYLSPDAEVRARLEAMPRAEVSFNYLGQFDSAAGDAPTFAAAPEGPGPAHSPRGQRSHRVDLVARIAEKRLHMTWTYSEQFNCRSTIERLAESYVRALNSLIDHCLSPDTGGFTPSDFPDAGIDQRSLDRLLGRLAKF